MRKCNKCGKTKADNAFSPSQPSGKQGGRKGDGLRRVCKDCTAKQQRDYIANLPATKRDAIRRKRVGQVKEWNRNNPAYQKAAKANLHARRVGAKGKVSGKDVLAVWEMYGNQCWCCGQAATEIDHYRPINKAAGGTNTKDNLRPICRECNQKRSHFWHGDEVAVKEAGLLKQLKELLHGAAE